MCKTTVVSLVLVGYVGSNLALAHPPTGIVVNEEGQVYFLKFLVGSADKHRSQLWRLDPHGTLKNIPVTRDDRSLGRPHNLAIDGHGDLYLSGFVKVSRDGSLSTVASFLGRSRPFWDTPLAVDRHGNV